MPIRINRKLSEIKQKERRDGRGWRKKYSKSYYFDNKIEPYDTLVTDIQDAYLLLYANRKVHGGNFFSIKKKYIKKYDYDIIGILKLLHKFYKYDNKKLTCKNLLLSWGFAFDVKSKFYKKWCDSFPFSRSVEIPSTLPDPYETYFDNSSKSNRKEREDAVTNYSFGKLENLVTTYNYNFIRTILAFEIQYSVGGINNPILFAQNPFIQKNAEEKHLCKLFDTFINKKIEKRRSKMTQKQYERYQKMLKCRQYLDLLMDENLK